tara:strand:+ start:7081 stop:7269 length:189 start_codon:yes stop_codon:yes gene_type:complete
MSGIFIWMENECGYCSLVISEVPQQQDLTKEKLMSLPEIETYEMFADQERTTLRWARLFKQG